MKSKKLNTEPRLFSIKDIVKFIMEKINQLILCIDNLIYRDRANYCFVDFGDINVAREILIKVNGEPIPGTTVCQFL